MNDGSGYSKLTHYDGTSLTYSVTQTNEAIVAGSKYYFKYLAKNSKGSSDYSNEIHVGASSLPNTPNAPYVDLTKSTLAKMYIKWDAVTDVSLATTGYKLYRDDGNNGNFNLVYDGTGKPGTLYYYDKTMTSGKAYRYKVRSINFNGESDDSDESLIYNCLAPTDIALPSYVSSTSTTLTLKWSSPK